MAVRSLMDRRLVGGPKLGARVVVSDISSVQLDFNRRKVAESGLSSAVEDRRIVDVRDLAAFADGSFDATVAYGGPLSYAFEEAGHALAECLRTTRAGGVVLASVMATIGTMRYFLPTVVDEIEAFGSR